MADGEDTRSRIALHWRNRVMTCSKCWSVDGVPILKPEFTFMASTVRFRNRYRVPHVGSAYGTPRIVFVGLEDPEDVNGRGPEHPDAEIVQLGTYLVKGPKRDDRHRQGEILLAHDLLGISNDASGSAIFDRISSINSHLCSLVAGSERMSASHCLKSKCTEAWTVIFDLLVPDLLVLEGKRVVWDEAWQQVKERGWSAEDLMPAADHARSRLMRIRAPERTFTLLALYHPSRWWSSRNRAYYRDTVRPAVETLRAVPTSA